METDRHYFLVGSFVMAGVVAALVFTVWLTSMGGGDFVTYRIKFAESVSGLSVGGAVKFRGVNVGSVKTIMIEPTDNRLIRVDIQVEKKTPIKVDTVASLKLQGITGVVFVELSGGGQRSPFLLSVTDRNVVPEIKAQSSTLSAIMDRLPEIMDKVSKGVDQIDKLFSDRNVQSFSDLLARLDDSSKNLAPMLKNLNRSSEQLDPIMHDLKNASGHISDLSEKADDDPASLIFGGGDKNGVPAP